MRDSTLKKNITAVLFVAYRFQANATFRNILVFTLERNLTAAQFVTNLFHEKAAFRAI
jgi:hypothetical protein